MNLYSKTFQVRTDTQPKCSPMIKHGPSEKRLKTKGSVYLVKTDIKVHKITFFLLKQTSRCTSDIKVVKTDFKVHKITFFFLEVNDKEKEKAVNIF
jgi:hypothetical protein